ncbi:hypothetical protein ACTJJ7_16490 [Phyllobacterium sp. 22229]|uniref:hypothetical protein n=1 Tax=Phyllobacterium sp. 22229 TaxID=3453895 RepID=UPI003F84DCE4
MATRAQNERFIETRGYRAPREAIEILFDRYGLAMLSDEQLAEVVNEMISNERFRNRLNRENRRIISSHAERMSS